MEGPTRRFEPGVLEFLFKLARDRGVDDGLGVEEQVVGRESMRSRRSVIISQLGLSWISCDLE